MKNFSVNTKTPIFNEFVVSSKISVDTVFKKLLEENIIGGLDLARFYPEMNNSFLACLTEKHKKEDIDKLVSVLNTL